MPAALYAVFGNPIAHSRSPEIHKMFAAQEGADIRYGKILVENGFAAALDAFAADGGCGANVTVPFKTQAFDLCEELSADAQKSGAVNTLIRLPENGGKTRWRGDNTDGTGLVADLHRLGFAPESARILLLGAGGAVRGVLPALLAQNPATVFIANRSADKAQTLAQKFGIQAALWQDCADCAPDIVINGTSASLAQEKLPLPDHFFRGVALAYDMVYAAAPTPFLRQAAAGGAGDCADGLGMLVGQAAASYALWRGFTPDCAAVLAALAKQVRG